MAKHNRNYKPEDIMFPDQHITTSNLVDEMEKSYIEYAMSVIVGRALPDVRDGLKPVHRRILYTMYEDGLTSDKKYKKSATTVGSVLGSYHPHGDASVYDAMVRLAQDFSMRYVLVDGQGNFGDIDGNPAAAYRYTEARLSKLSNEMLRDIDKDTVNWDPNFDESKKEPRVLPSRFPNLLVNGSIASQINARLRPQTISDRIYEGIDLSPVFNATYYGGRYPDLLAAGLKSPDQLWMHFTTFGMLEARQASADFSPVTYRNTNQDLNAAFGDDWEAYYKHYCMCGKAEIESGQRKRMY